MPCSDYICNYNHHAQVRLIIITFITSAFLWRRPVRVDYAIELDNCYSALMKSLMTSHPVTSAFQSMLNTLIVSDRIIHVKQL